MQYVADSLQARLLQAQAVLLQCARCESTTQTGNLAPEAPTCTAAYVPQDAVKAANDSPEGGVVYLPAGRYRIDKPIVVSSSNVVIRGDGVS